MLDKQTRSAILALRSKGHNQCEISRALGVSRNSVKRVIREGTAEPGALERASRLDEHLEDIRALYAGSGGGAGFSLGWAQDGNGQSVNLPDVSYVKVDVLSQKIEIDGIVAVPEPAAWTLCFGGLGLAWCLRQRK